MTTSLACAGVTWFCAGPGADVIDDVGKSVSTKSGVHYSSAIKVDSGPGDDDVTVGTAWMIYAGSGDELSGGPGHDELYAGYECDTTIHRGPGSLVDSRPNELYGGDGNDYLTGDKGADHLDGGSGNDEGDGGWKDAGNNFITSVETLHAGCGMDF